MLNSTNFDFLTLILSIIYFQSLRIAKSLVTLKRITEGQVVLRVKFDPDKKDNKNERMESVVALFSRLKVVYFSAKIFLEQLFFGSPSNIGNHLTTI